MYLYYFGHSFWNQFKRFVRTWAFAMVIVFITIGGLLAYAARWYYERLSAMDELIPQDFMEFFDAGGLTGLDALELSAGLLIQAIFFTILLLAFSCRHNIYCSFTASLA